MCYAGAQLLIGLVYSAFYLLDIEVTAWGCTSSTMISYLFGTATILSYLSTILCRYRHVKLGEKCSNRLIFALISYPYLSVIPQLLYQWLVVGSKDYIETRFCKILYSSKFRFLFGGLLSFWDFDITFSSDRTFIETAQAPKAPFQDNFRKFANKQKWIGSFENRTEHSESSSDTGCISCRTLTAYDSADCFWFLAPLRCETAPYL